MYIYFLQVVISPPCRLDSPFNQHILHRIPIGTMHLLVQFFLGQPFEISQPELVILQVRLATHYPRFHEESLLSQLLDL